MKEPCTSLFFKRFLIIRREESRWIDFFLDHRNVAESPQRIHTWSSISHVFYPGTYKNLFPRIDESNFYTQRGLISALLVSRCVPSFTDFICKYARLDAVYQLALVSRHDPISRVFRNKLRQMWNNYARKGRGTSLRFVKGCERDLCLICLTNYTWIWFL